MTWRSSVEPLIRPFFFLFSRLTRGKTLGVRIIARDDAGRIMLVRHTYLDGWWLPGGGVDGGQTLEDAAVRELREETGLTATARPVLVSVHSNERFFPGDHVAVYRIDQWDEGELSSHHEIAETGFFAPEALPDDVNRGSAARIRELLQGGPPDPAW